MNKRLLLPDGSYVTNGGRSSLTSYLKALPAKINRYLDDGTDDDVTLFWSDARGIVKVTVDIVKPKHPDAVHHS